MLSTFFKFNFIRSIMTLQEFKSTLTAHHPSGDLSDCLRALWYDHNQNWEKAHDIAQHIDDKNGSLIHAYLHRKEGDLWNAEYWYRKAGKLMPDYALEKEWDEIVSGFL
jgi:hypothetical protein